jgi:hypothetical protein
MIRVYRYEMLKGKHTFGEHSILAKGIGKFETFRRFYPGVIVESAFDVNHLSISLFISMEPDICHLLA